MDFDVQTDLINRAQIGFREVAGLSSFNSKDTTLPSLPTVEASISTLDSSPSYLRCKYCQGKLLRGLQSLICMYCGEYQKKDLHPDPISFNSTIGYRWLLQSLNINGSERVGSLSEGFGITGGQSPVEDVIPLSDFLDLQISCQYEPKKPKNSFDNKASEHSSSMNVGTADLGNFFLESERAVVSEPYEEQPVASKDAQSMVFGDQENLTLFPNVLPLEASVTSSNDVNGDTSSGWNAEFQFSDAKRESENPKPVEPFVGFEADLSVHMDTVFGQIEGHTNRKLNDDTDPFPSTGKDWIQDDPFASMSSATFQQAEKPESLQAKDKLSGHDLSLQDLDGDWFSDANWEKSNANNTSTIKNVDLFDIEVKPQVNAVSSPSLANDLIQNDLLFNVGSQTSLHTGGSDFNNSNKQYSDNNDWFQDSQWLNGPSSTTNIVASNDDEEFDEWNDFTSSSGIQGSFPDSWKHGNENASGSEKMSELNLFPSTANPQEVDFGNFLQPDLFSGSPSNKKPNDAHTVYDIFSEVSTVSRNATAGSGNSAEGPKNDEITPNETAHPKNDAQALLSQMHDLSFMLKSELSIPSKPDEFGSFHA